MVWQWRPCKKEEVSATELVEEAIKRIEEFNPNLNAVVYKMYDLAKEVAKNPKQVDSQESVLAQRYNVSF